MKNQNYICIKVTYLINLKISLILTCNLILIKVKGIWIKVYIKYLLYISLITKVSIYFIKANLYFGLMFLFHFINFDSLS